jgi:hypothetical protein
MAKFKGMKIFIFTWLLVYFSFFNFALCNDDVCFLLNLHCVMMNLMLTGANLESYQICLVEKHGTLSHLYLPKHE